MSNNNSDIVPMGKAIAIIIGILLPVVLGVGSVLVYLFMNLSRDVVSWRWDYPIS